MGPSPENSPVTIAPSVTATLEPIMDAILAIVPILESVGPVAVATGQPARDQDARTIRHGVRGW